MLTVITLCIFLCSCVVTQDIVFPTQDTSISSSPQFNLSTPTTSDKRVEELSLFVPAGCDGSDYCEESLDYPDNETLIEIINNNSDNHLLQQLFTMTGVISENSGDEYNIEHDYELLEYSPLCDTIDNIVRPTTAKTATNQWR